MRACAVDLDKLRGNLVAYIESASLITDRGEDSTPLAEFERIIRRAVTHVQSSGRKQITGANVLVAILTEHESRAACFLQEQGLSLTFRGSGAQFGTNFLCNFTPENAPL